MLENPMEQELHIIKGREDGQRLSSRILEEKIQQAVADGHRALLIEAFGQHGIGGRLWKAGSDPVYVKITGNSGQRTGSLGFPNTRLEIMGPASDDVGWLNAGAEIVVRGHAGNGLANAMAQGKIFVAGNTGARAMTMTKHNPRFPHPEVWVLGSVGDYFGEFMAGGIAVICGVDPQDTENVLGYRPLVGMVGGQVFFRGPHKGFSTADAIQIPISDDQWAWFAENLKVFLNQLHRTELLDTLLNRSEWNLLVSRSVRDKSGASKRSMSSFRKEVWDRELGIGGLIGDLTTIDRRPIPLIPTGPFRRFVPLWANQKYLAPCEATCPSGIPVQERWRLIREGRIDEAVDLALAYTPFPATVCGYLCPNPCMQACTRQTQIMAPVDTTQLGKASINARIPDLSPLSGKRIGVIGGGPAGISIAWQLRQQGHEAVIHDRAGLLGGKIASLIPESRIPKEVLSAELSRVREVIPHVDLSQNLDREAFEGLKNTFDFLVVATGAQKPRTLPVPGNERLITASDFLARAKNGGVTPGNRVVIIGAGNVGCDVATEAHRLGAAELTLIDVQEPAAFGKERKEAETAGAKFRWPCFTKEITADGVVLDSGELIPADTVVVSIGDVPDLDFLPEDIAKDRGFVKVDEWFQSSDPKIFAIGDAVRPGLLTDAIGAGRTAATAINDIINGQRTLESGTALKKKQMIERSRVSLEYFDPRISELNDPQSCGSQCASCGACRDCGICVAVCPQAAIERVQKQGPDYEYRVDADKCIGCGFCAGACPCGVWEMAANEPME